MYCNEPVWSHWQEGESSCPILCVLVSSNCPILHLHIGVIRFIVKFTSWNHDFLGYVSVVLLFCIPLPYFLLYVINLYSIILLYLSHLSTFPNLIICLLPRFLWSLCGSESMSSKSFCTSLLPVPLILFTECNDMSNF